MSDTRIIIDTRNRLRKLDVKGFTTEDGDIWDAVLIDETTGKSWEVKVRMTLSKEFWDLLEPKDIVEIDDIRGVEE